jgi:hypothetical protein
MTPRLSIQERLKSRPITKDEVFALLDLRERAAALQRQYEARRDDLGSRLSAGAAVDPNIKLDDLLIRLLMD